MKDQVDGLRARGIPAGFLNSSLSATEQREVLRGMEQGEIKLIYVAPERFRYEGFLQTISRLPLSLFAIDEAHCISQWGHDFRPDYYRIGQVLQRLGHPQVVALTATASPAVQADILQALHLPEARRFVAGFSRPNLSLRVRLTHNEAEKFARVRELVRALRTGIIYCATRKKVEAVAREMTHWKIPFVYYHGGLSDRERALAQEKFLRGEACVAVATNAFGMGIDRADLRFVIHFEVPGSIEAYYQEVGRAGRDGQPATCELLFQHSDVRVQEFFLEGANPSIEIITGLWKALRENAKDNAVELSLSDLATLVPGCKNEMAVGSAMVVLQKAGYLERRDVPGQLTRLTHLVQPEVMPHRLEIDRQALDEKERIDRDRLRQVIEFVHARECRQRFTRQGRARRRTRSAHNLWNPPGRRRRLSRRAAA
jgi:ATP-dependent DNA helicase RecQ